MSDDQSLEAYRWFTLLVEWRKLELECARLAKSDPEAWEVLADAWADDGWLVPPPWLTPDAE